MKRLPLLFVALVLAGGFAAGCSKTADVATPNVPNVDNIQADAAKCTEMATSYASMFTPLATGGTDADKEKIQKAIDDMKAQVPDSVDANLTTIADGIKNAKDMTGVATFLSSSEFTTANTSVTKYLTTECAKVGC
jgi:hypothetical protein